MADQSKIQWTNATWNPLAGCDIVSKGCKSCYAMRDAWRLQNNPNPKIAGKYEGTTRLVNGHPVWTGRINLASNDTLLQPLYWKLPRLIFVNSMSDLFAEAVPIEAIDKVFAVMALASRMHMHAPPGHVGPKRHVMQLLTKRPGRAGNYLREAARDIFAWRDRLNDAIATLGLSSDFYELIDSTELPLPNLWLGTSVEDQVTADERIPLLLDTPAAVRWISAEPLLAPVDFEPWLEWKIDELPNGDSWGCPGCEDSFNGGTGCKCPNNKAVFHIKEGPKDPDGMPEWMTHDRKTIDWVVCGGESGAKARPMHPDWARMLRDQCAAAGTPFFFKQWGEWTPGENFGPSDRTETGATWFGGKWMMERVSPKAGEEMHIDDEPDVWKAGKKRAGRLLDGVEHNDFPRAK